MTLRAENISKRYFRKTGQANFFEAVKETSLILAPGAVTVLAGRSGSGKTTLLHMLSGLLAPSEGKVFLDETDLYALPDERLSRLRNEKIAVVPQGRSAVSTLTALENILLPARLYRRPVRAEAAIAWMEALGIAGLQNTAPAELSGGELRRMAIARALHQDAPLLLADEPTGDLDDENTARVLAILRDAAHRDGKTVLLVSHEPDAARYADRLLTLDAGRLTEG